MKYYVYVVKIGDEIVYIGKGSGARFEHVNSGTSHNYFLNKAHFEGIAMDVSIAFRFETDLEATLKESELISEHKPKWNYIGNPTKVRRRSSNRRKPGAGVMYYEGKPKPWRAYMHKDGKKKHIGYYDTEEEAIEARSSYI